MDQKKKTEKREINQAVDETPASANATKPRSLRLSADTMDDLGSLKRLWESIIWTKWCAPC